MSRKTSVYLNPQLEQLVEAKGDPLPEALYRGLSVVPMLIEDNDGFQTHWFCSPPLPGLRFKVHHDHWRELDGRPIREIYEIEITDQGKSAR